MLPYFAGRAETLWAQLGSRSADGSDADVLKRLSKPPIEYFKMFYADTVLGGSTSALRCGLDFFGALVFGQGGQHALQRGDLLGLRDGGHVVELELSLGAVGALLEFGDRIAIGGIAERDGQRLPRTHERHGEQPAQLRIVRDGPLEVGLRARGRDREHLAREIPAATLLEQAALDLPGTEGPVRARRLAFAAIEARPRPTPGRFRRLLLAQAQRGDKARQPFGQLIGLGPYGFPLPVAPKQRERIGLHRHINLMNNRIFQFNTKHSIIH